VRPVARDGPHDSKRYPTVENAVEDDEVVVRVDIERGAEAMKGSSPCGSPRTLGFAPPP
jgi:hypothetical protein